MDLEINVLNVESKKLKDRIKNLKNFKKGVKELTPRQMLTTNKWAGIGGSVGLTLAWGTMAWSLYQDWDWRTFGYFILVTFFIPMLINQYRSAMQQIKALEEAEKNKDKLMQGFK